MMRLAIWLVAVVSNGQPHAVLTDLTGPSLADGLAWQGIPCASGIARIIDRRKP